MASHPVFIVCVPSLPPRRAASSRLRYTVQFIVHTRTRHELCCGLFVHSTRASLISNHCGSRHSPLLSDHSLHRHNVFPCRPYRRVVLCIVFAYISNWRRTRHTFKSSRVESSAERYSSVQSKGTLQSPDSIRSDPEIRATRAAATRELVSHVIRCTQCVRACVSIFLSALSSAN